MVNAALILVVLVAGCSRNSDEIDGPQPVLSSAQPDLVCVEQADHTVVLSGESLAPLVLDAATDDPEVLLPQISLLRTRDLDGGAVDADGIVLNPERVSWESQQSLSVLLGPSDGLLPGLYAILLENGSGQTAELADALTVVPPPELLSVDPDLVCLEQGGVGLVLSGSGFLDIDGVLPTVSLGGLVLSATGLDDCQDLTGAPVTVQSCSVLALQIDQDALGAGAYSVVVTNPPEADCHSTESVSLAVVHGPVVESVEPQLFCAEQQDVEMTIQGTGFLDVDGSLPSVVIDDTVYPAQALTGCSPVQGTLLDALSCTGLVFTLPAGAHEAGARDLSVQNPPPAGCEFLQQPAFFLVPAPQIIMVSPDIPCDQDPENLTVHGNDFLDLDGQPPLVTVQGVESTVTSLDGCAATDSPAGVQADLCTSIHVQVPAGTVSPGNFTAQVQNPDLMGCSTSLESSIGLPPVVSGVDPSLLCTSGGSLTVTGDGFIDWAVVSISNAQNSLDLATTYVDAQTLLAELPDGTMPGLYDVIVTNPDGCSGTQPAIFDVAPLPVIYFVDPPTVYNGINLQVVIYTSGISGQVVEVLLYPAGQPQDATSLDFSYVQTRRIQAIIPAGLAPGPYTVQVTDDLACAGVLGGAVDIVEDLTVAIDRVELPFGWTDAETGVNVYSPDPPPVGMANFQATPRFFLNPASAGPGSLASELRRTAYVSPLRTSAVVPAGLPAGLYDLVAVNPDGGIGLLPDAFEVTVEPPPVIVELAPASVINQSFQYVTLLGDNFRNPAFSAACLQPDSSEVPLDAAILAWDATFLELEFDFVTQTIQDGSCCIVRVTNDDLTYADFSALAVTNPSLNLSNFSATSDLNIARRAPCVVAGEVVPGARFLYTIGGDDGTTQDSVANTYHDSVEIAAVDPYGDLSPWTILPYTLPLPRSFHACTTIGRYVFVFGGNGGAGAQSTVWRAKVLDPAQAPEITDVDLTVDPEQAALLLPGRYSYRVSALMPADHPINPGGESLAGDPFLIQTPDIAERISITIIWSEVPDAVGYRVYRTPDRDQPSGYELLLAEVAPDPRAYTDDGGLAPSVRAPLPFGALGRFASMADMNAAREGAGIAQARDPVDGSLVHVYVMGGRDETASGLASLERLTVEELGDGSLNVAAAWVDGTADIGPPRWQVGTFTATDLSGPDVVPAGETWIYAGGGLSDDTSTLVPDMVAMKVEAGGALGETAGNRYLVGTMQPFKAGYASMLFNNQLFAFGGTNAMPVTEGSSVEMCLDDSGSCIGGNPEPPDLMNWNNLGINLTVARYLTSSVTVSAFIFLVGGIDITFQPLAATEKTLW